MQGKIEFSTIVPSFVVRIGLEQLSLRDQSQLCRELMDRLGILDRLSEEADATARAQKIITEQWSAAWDGKVWARR